MALPEELLAMAYYMKPYGQDNKVKTLRYWHVNSNQRPAGWSSQ